MGSIYDYISKSEPLQETLLRYDKDTIPLVIEDWHKHPDWLGQKFNLEWLREHGQKDIAVRNIHDWSDHTVSLEQFTKHCRSASHFVAPGETVRWYGKDAECPADWDEWLHKSGVIPSRLLPNDSRNYLTKLPKSATVETLMCYLGIGETFTPCHKDLCASSGHNLMCYTENDGSSFWFMTKGSDALEVAEYFRALKQELDHEMHVVTIEELARAPFDVYITQQKLGDLVLVPPRSCHQVVNYGGITIKTSWSRMTLKGLAVALHHELPMYQRVCRRETYRIKSTIYHALHRSRIELEDLIRGDRSRRTKVVANRLSTLLRLFDYILTNECPPENIQIPTISETSGCDENDEDVHVVCDFCGADAFQSFFECHTCVPSNPESSAIATHGNGYTICPACYSEGRSCRCETMKAVQCRPFKVLVQERQKTIKVLRDCEALEPSPRFDFEQEKKLFSDDRPGVFRAACVLADQRRQADARTCTIPRKSSHLVPSTWALYCRRCHSTKCYLHLATNFHMHSVEALLLHDKDRENSSYHQRHVLLRNSYGSKLPAFLRATENGTVPDASMRSVYNASTFDRCKPMNPTFMKLGWYDRHADIVMINNDSIERGADASERIEESPLSLDSGPAANSPSIRGTLHPSSNGESSSSKACKDDKSIQSKKRKHDFNVMIPTLSSLKLQPEMFVIMPSSSKPTNTGPGGNHPQNDRSSALQTSQLISSKPSTKRTSVVTKAAPRPSSTINQPSRTSTTWKGNQQMHAGRPATNPSATVVSSPPADLSRSIVPAKRGAKPSPSVDQPSRSNGPKPSGSKPPRYRFKSKETVPGTSSSESEDEGRPPKKARLGLPSSSQRDILKTLTFKKKPSPASENKGKPPHSSGTEQNPTFRSLADAYNSLCDSETPEAARRSVSNSNAISQASVTEGSRGGSPSLGSQPPDTEAPSNSGHSDNAPVQTSTQQTHAGVSSLGLSSTTPSSHVDVPMVDGTRSQTDLQQEGASAPRISSSAPAPYNDMQFSSAMNITEGITQIVVAVIQQMQAGVVPVNPGTSPQESNLNGHVSRFGPPSNVREENSTPPFNHQYQYHSSNRGRGRPWVPSSRNTQYQSRFDQPHSNSNFSSHGNPRYRNRGGFQTHSYHHHWYHPYDESPHEEAREAYVDNTDLFVISSEPFWRVPSSSTATGTSPPPKVSATNPSTQIVPPPGAAAQPPPPPPSPPVHIRVRSPSPTQDWEENYADIMSNL
ncbi:hypothetical protein EV421DRAFT_1899252 [Armillaria borealis]|uniref:JmjC domain-containing protein n=1 Tax=Armillaria borealis TaxID=47425 RepID=A0AA39MYR2_9AGAR|nr:hypothetical protein EV421DRAFT_1899252 [Armillaria borealis]